MLSNLVAVQYSDSAIPQAVIVLPCEFGQDGSRWTAECLPLGTAAYADSLEAARHELGEAVMLQLNQMEQLGYIEDFLKERRVQVHQLKPPRQGVGTGATWAEPLPAAV
jgi:hypothetical protein